MFLSSTYYDEFQEIKEAAMKTGEPLLPITTNGEGKTVVIST